MPKARLVLISFLLLLSFSIVSTASDFTYKVIEKEELGTIKLMLTVRLSKKISEEQLRQLALDLRAKEPKQYDRVFITYYQPGMEVGAGAWATTHFNPNLVVSILGMTAEQEAKILQAKPKASAQVVGTWYNQQLGKVTIMKKDSEHVIETLYYDGSKGTDKVVSYTLRGRPAFKEPDNELGEHYIVEANGNLGLYDNLGLIMMLSPVK